MSFGLLLVDHRDGLLEPIQDSLSAIAQPIRFIASFPDRVGQLATEITTSRRELIQENQRLKDRQQVYQARLQRLDALEVENIRLRSLLDSSYELERPVVIAELTAVDLDPFNHLIQINKGLRDSITAGQPVIDANGVIGQVETVSPFTATVRLISDPSHGIPVQVNRNGLRSVAFGTGRTDTLTITSLPNNASIEVGDLLVTSGLGGRFPAGYPVGEVRSVSIDESKAFSSIDVKPLGALGRVEEVLLIEEGGNRRE
ncbi:rod shape-determining protein MreC [Spiribacter vilamensis]|uniref:Cell shape-determining protein MreC n=2 Tax=Spiribacter vilamensis TaxID=531306 RepID=A0A4V6MHF4_9GAMM|nr:rod shape-determining protein MreC [Spiribacter vilamensis]